jgi:hypothetical protein
MVNMHLRYLIGEDLMKLRRSSPGERNRLQTVSKTVTQVSIPHPLDPHDNRSIVFCKVPRWLHPKREE